MYKIGRSNIYFILAVALFLHLTILHHASIFTATPDLMLACVIFFALFLGPGAGLESGLAAGLMKDLFALDFFGINMFVYGVIGLLAGSLSAKLSKESKRIRAIVVFVLTALSMSLHYLLVSIFTQSLGIRFTEYLARSVIPVSLYTAAVSIPIFMKFVDMYGLRGSEEYL